MNLQTVENILAAQKKALVSDISQWLSYLETAAYSYKHPVEYQIMINAYMPEAKACCDSKTWDKLRRDISSPISGIPVIFDGKLEFLYDISQTSKRPDGITPWIWSIEDNALNTSYADIVNSSLSAKYELKAETFFDNLYEMAYNKTSEYFVNDSPELLRLTAESAAYCVMSRCCPDEARPSIKNLRYLSESEFDDVSFRVNRVAGDILSEIEHITKAERNKLIESIRSKNNGEKNLQGRKDNRRGSSRTGFSDRDMDSGDKVRQVRDNMGTGRANGENEILSDFRQKAEIFGDNKGNDGQPVRRDGRDEQAGRGAHGEIWNDGSAVRPDTAGGSISVLQDNTGVLEGNSGRGNTGGESAREIHNAASGLSDESSAGRIHENEEVRKTELSSGSRESESARNSGTDNRADEGRKSGIQTSGGTSRLPENSAADGIVQSSSGRNDTQRDNLQRINQPDIIGNTVYKYIRQKTYRKYDTEIALKIADELDRNGIKFSGKVNGESTTLTISKDDLEKYSEIAERITGEKDKFANGEPEKEVTITQADIDLLRSLEPRKSVLNFTAEEIKLTENWQQRFDSDISKKSPYYRAVNGDWREHDDSRVSIIEVEDRNADFKSVRDDIKSQTIKRGNVINHDTNWLIQISRNGLEDSVKYAFTHKDNTVYNMLYHIQDIVESGTLLDSVISEKNNSNKANNTSFMHKFYNVFRFNGEPYLAKTTVEEFADSQSGTLKRVYNIQDIKIEPLRHIEFADNNQLARSVLNGSDISISELFGIVKNCDGDFYLNKRETEKEVTITQADIDLLRSLEPRKSVLNFTAEEIKLTENWQQRFDSDISKKSPYYRAVNGDWREHDDSRVSIIEVEDRNADFTSVSEDIKSQVIKRGNTVNNDTMWSIQISRRGLEDSLTYARRHNDTAVFNMLYNVDDIVKNSSYLDCVVSEKNNGNKANNTAFMHKFYCICKCNNEPYLAKIAVEEFADSKNGTLKRLYNVQDIKIEPLRHAAFTENNQLALSVLNGSDISISELFGIVKNCDGDFYLNKRELEKEVNITQADLDLLRSLEPRKSILNFTAEEIKLTENWQQRFDSDISQKSPYYRAVNGDWREHDDSRVSIIEINDRHATLDSTRDDIKSQVIQRGTVINKDSGWSIQISRKGLEDTVAYASRHKNPVALNALYQLNNLIENSIYLDTNLSEHNNNNKSVNTAFMHKMYSPIVFNDREYIAKLTIEEFFDGRESTSKRLYNLQDIKIEPLRHVSFTDLNQPHLKVLNGSDISISELFELVKNCDKDFYLNKRETENESEKTLPEEYYSIRRMSDGTYSLYALSCNGAPVIVTPFIETEQNAAALFSETNENREDVSCTLIPFEQMEQMAQEQLKNEDTSVFYRINTYLDVFRNKNRDENEVTHFIQEYIENENGTAAIGRILYKGDFKNCNAALRRFLTIKQFAKESEIPFSNEFSDGVDDDFDPFAYNGDMSIDDYKNVQSEFLNESEFSNGESEKNEYTASQFDLRCEYVNDEIRVYNTLNDNKAIAFIDSARNTAFLGEDNIPETVKKQVLHMAENYALPYNIPEPEKALPGEPVVIIGQTEHPELREGMKFPLSQADKLFDELDKKQQSDREIYENAGWYHKTDFLIEYEINGQKATYDGRYDIGDGDGTLTEHIKAFAENVLKDDYMKKFWQEKNQLEEKTEQFKYLLSDVIPMFESYSSAERDRHYPVITAENYDISRAVTDIFKNKGKDIRRTDIPIKASDELRRRFELYGVKPSDEQTEITFSTYGNDYDWNRFEIRDRFGNRWVNVYAKDILSEDELETMKSVVSDFYNENLHSEERSGIEEFIDVSDNEYEDSQKTGNNLYVYDAEPKMQQMSLFGDDVADFTSENERKEEIITAVLMRGSGFVDGKFRIADYAKENHSIEDFAKMLKKEYGTGGRSGDDKTHSFEDHDSKGIRITLIRKNELEEGKIIKLSWTDAAKRISELCSNGKYITQNDIDERIRHAKYNLKVFAGKTKYEMSEIEWAHKVLDEYGVEYPEKKEISINPYRIYQIKDGEEYHGIRFERIDSLRKSGVELNISDYDLVYEGNLNDIEGDSFDEKLNNLYDLFNFELPENFKGHSLSVSDVITVGIDKNERAYYVDTLGFVDMPEFLNEKAAPETENKISVGDKFRNKATGEISEVVSLTGALPWYTDQCTINRETGGFSITENISYDKLLNTELYEYIDNGDRAAEQTVPDKAEVTSDAALSDKFDKIKYAQKLCDAVGLTQEQSDKYMALINTEPKKINTFTLSSIIMPKTIDIDKARVFASKLSDDSEMSNIKLVGIIYNPFRELALSETLDERIISALDSEPEHHAFNKGNNFTITDNLIVSGAKAKFRANIAAIETLKSIEAEKRSATPEEQATMSHYSGWGGLSSAFDESKTEWADEYEQLKELLTDEEYESARASVLDSFYTPTFIIDSVYTALNNMGFEGGNILEPSLGIGNFLGKMPEDMYDKSSIYGTELDSISGRIAKQLYPNADITVTGFEKKDFPDNFFDIAVGNVPFGSSKIPDRRYDKYNFAVHDYFFAKTLDKVRPGGIVAFVTSKGTLDKANPAVRKYISQRAELLGAIRLPNTAFKSYAGTEVTSDIIFLQKREMLWSSIFVTP